MNIQYKTHEVTLADDVRALLTAKLAPVEKLYAHEAPENLSCEVILAHDTKHHSGTTYRADITLFVGGERTHAIGHGETLQAAVDTAKDELVGRLRREKGKHETLLRRGSRMIKKMMRWG